MFVIAFLIFSWMFLYGTEGVGLIGPNRSTIEGDFGLSHTTFGVGLGVMQLVCAVVALLLAPKLRKYRGVTVLTGSLLAQALGFFIIYWSHNLTGLAGGWFIVTFGGLLGAVTNSLSAGLFPGRPRVGLLLMHGCNAFGKVAGPVLVAVCLASGWRISFGVVGVLTALLAGAFALYRGRFNPKVPEGNPTTPVHTEATTAEVLRLPGFWMAILPFCLISGSELAFVTLMPLYFIKHFGLSPQMAGTMLTVQLLGQAVGRFSFLPFGKRITPNQIIAVGVCSTLFIFPGMLTHSVPVRIVCLFLSGWMFAGTWPIYYEHISASLPNHLIMFDYGSGLASTVGISICIWISSSIADTNLSAAVFFGPILMLVFGLLYFNSSISNKRAPLIAAAQHEAA